MKKRDLVAGIEQGRLTPAPVRRQAERRASR
jgi:hypothetical protein